MQILSLRGVLMKSERPALAGNLGFSEVSNVLKKILYGFYPLGRYNSALSGIL